MVQALYYSSRWISEKQENDNCIKNVVQIMWFEKFYDAFSFLDF